MRPLMSVAASVLDGRVVLLSTARRARRRAEWPTDGGVTPRPTRARTPTRAMPIGRRSHRRRRRPDRSSRNWRTRTTIRTTAAAAACSANEPHLHQRRLARSRAAPETIACLAADKCLNIGGVLHDGRLHDHELDVPDAGRASAPVRPARRSAPRTTPHPRRDVLHDG